MRQKSNTPETPSERLVRDERVQLPVELCEVFFCPIYLGASAEPWFEVTDSHAKPVRRGFRVF